jgi:malonyl-CoA O-methyltransferase
LPPFPSARTSLDDVPATPPLSNARLSAPIELDRVNKLFADPARIAESNFLRREIATRMFERLELVRLSPRHIIDAGCGAGADLPVLQERYPAAQLSGVDSSAAMLEAARASQQAALSSVNRLLGKWLPAKLGASVGLGAAAELVCADFAGLPFEPASADLVWSNLALHWHPQPDRVFAEWRRVLRVDGLLMFSCFGPDTFKELRAAFAVLDDTPHTLPFVDMHDFGDMLVDVGFSTPVMDMETITVTYTSAQKLLADVSALGGNPLATRRQGLIGRQAWARVIAGLEAQRRADGTMALSFEVIYGHAFRPVSRKTAQGESIVRFDLPKK